MLLLQVHNLVTLCSTTVLCSVIIYTFCSGVLIMKLGCMILAVGGLILPTRFQSKSSAYAAKHSSMPQLKLR
jgi:hypothetical protein